MTANAMRTPPVKAPMYPFSAIAPADAVSSLYAVQAIFGEDGQNRGRRSRRCAAQSLMRHGGDARVDK